MRSGTSFSHLFTDFFEASQGIMNHLPWLAQKRSTLLQLMAEWSQSQGVLEELTGQLRRLGHGHGLRPSSGPGRDRPADQGPGELETGLRQVIAMVSPAAQRLKEISVVDCVSISHETFMERLLNVF